MTDSTSAGEPIPFGSNRSKTITLPPDVLRDASRRLGWAALVYSVTFFLAFFGSSYFFHGGPLGDAVVASMEAGLLGHRGARNLHVRVLGCLPALE